MSPCRAEARAEDARSALTRGPSRSYPWWSPSIRPQPTHTCFRRALFLSVDRAGRLSGRPLAGRVVLVMIDTGRWSGCGTGPSRACRCRRSSASLRGAFDLDDLSAGAAFVESANEHLN